MPHNTDQFVGMWLAILSAAALLGWAVGGIITILRRNR